MIERLDLYRVFTSWWWTVLVAAFTVSVIGNTVSRLPRLVRDVRAPLVKRGRAFFRSSVPSRTGPLVGLDGSVLPDLLRGMGYRVRLERIGGTTHLLGERNRLAPLASIVSHASLVLFVVGMGFVTPRFGHETALKVPVGEGRPTGFPDDPETVLVQNEEFVARFDDAGNPLDYRTTLAVYRSGVQIARKEVTVNDPLSVDGWVFFTRTSSDRPSRSISATRRASSCTPARSCWTAIWRGSLKGCWRFRAPTCRSSCSWRRVTAGSPS